MRNGYFIQLIFMALATLASASLAAQKLDIDKKQVVTSLMALPEKNIDTAFHTFSYQFNGDYILGNWGIDLGTAKKTYFKLTGYESLDNGGDLHLEATLSPIRFLESKVESRTVKSKDKAGRETSQTYYKCVVTYESDFTWSMRDKDRRDLIGRSIGLYRAVTKKYTCPEKNTYKEAYEAYDNNRHQINRDIAVNEIQTFLGEMSKDMNRMFGYRPDKDKFNLWIVDSKNHPEEEGFSKHFESVKAIFGAMSPYELKATDLEALRPSIEYYQSIPGKYKADEKADIKLRYAAYFNLANIHLFLDDPEKAMEYANLLIQNDYDKGDGKDFLKDAEKLRLLLFERKLPGRRLARR